MARPWKELLLILVIFVILLIILVRNKVVVVQVLCYVFNIKLQTARNSTILQLQGRDPDRKLRIDLLCTTIGGLEGVKKGFKVV